MDHGKSLETVSIADEALDLHAMKNDLGKFLSSRDGALIKLKPGKKPAKFVLRRIPTSVFQKFVSEGNSNGERWRRAFQMSIGKVSNYTDVDGAHHIVIEPEEKWSLRDGEWKYASEAMLDMFPPALIEELGSVAFTRSFLAPGNAASFQAPPSLLPVLVSLAALAAENAKKAALLSKENQAAPPTLEPEPDGDKPTDATVTTKATDSREGDQTPTPTA